MVESSCYYSIIQTQFSMQLFVSNTLPKLDACLRKENSVVKKMPR